MMYRKFFVVGCPRSGTSWLTKMIGSHPNILKVPSESHAYSHSLPLLYLFEKAEIKKKIEISNMDIKVLWFKTFVVRF